MSNDERMKKSHAEPVQRVPKPRPLLGEDDSSGNDHVSLCDLPMQRRTNLQENTGIGAGGGAGSSDVEYADERTKSTTDTFDTLSGIF